VRPSCWATALPSKEAATQLRSIPGALRIIEPETSEDFGAFVKQLEELRVVQNLKIGDPREAMKDTSYYADDDAPQRAADALVGGATVSDSSALAPCFS